MSDFVENANHEPARHFETQVLDHIILVGSDPEQLRQLNVVFGDVEVKATLTMVNGSNSLIFAMPPKGRLAGDRLGWSTCDRRGVFPLSDTELGAAPETIDDLLLAAKNYERDGKLGKALACARTVLAFEPDSFEGNFRKGRLLEKLGDKDSARAHSLHAFSLRPGHFRPATTLGRLALSEKRFDLAIHYFSFVKPQHDTYPEACVSIAKSLASLDRTAESISFLDAAHQSRPQRLSYLRDLGKALKNVGELEKAREVISSLKGAPGQSVSKELAEIERAIAREQIPRSVVAFRRAFSAKNEIGICCGSDPKSIAFAQSCEQVIATRTACDVTVVYGNADPKADVCYRLAAPEYEFCFVLPEALLDPEFREPSSVVRVSYLEEHRLQDLPQEKMESLYMEWILKKLGRTEFYRRQPCTT